MGGTYSVVADISRDTKNNAPPIYYGNGIGITRTDEPEIRKSDEGEEKQPLQNYKIYKHELPDNSGWSSTTYELKAINYKDKQQHGFDTVGFKTHKTVEVVYWLRDRYNSFPLVIGLGTTNLNYYRRKNDTSNRWERVERIVYPANLSDYNKVLPELNDKFKDVVVIQLQADKDYCGHPSVKQGDGPQVSCTGLSNVPIVTVTCNSKDHKGFDKYTHTGGLGSPIKLLSAAHGDKLHSFNIKDIDKQYQEVNVYYSSTDRGKIKPLVIGLVPVSGTQSEYYTFDGKLTRNRNINPGKLLDHLDKQNCLRNDIVVTDLSKRGKYCCGVNVHSKIQVLPNSRNNVPNGYTSYLHLPTGSAILSIHKFKSGGDTHTFSNLSGRITGIYAYFCKSDDQNKPLLLYVNKGSGSAWFKRTSGGNDTWIYTGLNSLQSYTPNSLSIKQPIEKVLHEICKELKITCQHASSSGTTPALGSPQDGGGSTGSGGSHTSGNSGVGSGTGTGYGGSSGSSGGGSTSVSSQQQETAVSHTPPGQAGPEGPAGEEGSSSSSGSGTSGSEGGAEGQGSVDLQKIVQKALTFIKSPEGIITASATPGIGGIIGVTIWKWPNIMSFLITRV
ncbi:hypothetical protein BEWA_031920 [Theileria equi strain WA]|uniref:Uncharacterized protein n=1 Tax=Theileria equi strain WA TaxID=1537102 RepID=L0AZM0_THEEQ|nr:hypothetical protein BEWA_031920 [Theileria equi strain WA]AFZ80339.1 hypothetical protein BEWA_031920 [Theileria equi strain WA]|eukprot:XP_004830005.1 hypothetical protein BEWA_031920 [Theileria equi strain WA]